MIWRYARTGAFTRYYIGYPSNDQRSFEIDRSPTIVSFEYDTQTNEIVNRTRAVVLPEETHAVRPSVGGSLVEGTSPNLHFFFTDGNGYIKEYTKHGY